MNKKLIFLLITIFMFVSLSLHLVEIDKVPPCLNADEAAYGYNAYSLLKSGKDEYGKFLPLRLKSFEDYKLPIYSYLSLPFVAIFGLNDFSTRAVNIFLGVAFVPLVFLIIKGLFKNEKIGLIGAFLTSVSSWIHIMSRQAQEGVAATFLILLSFYFLIRYLKKSKIVDFVLLNLFIFLSTFAYHFGRVFLFFFVLYELFLLIRERSGVPQSEPVGRKTIKTVLLKIVIIVAVSIVPLTIDYWSINRVSRLVFYQNIGFQLRLDQYLNEHNFRLLHNKGTEAVRSIINRYLEQISPEFLIVNGDKNWRFGFENLGLITLVEYAFIFIGLYYLFKNKEKYRFLILYLLFISPLASSLTWQEYSLIRTYPLIFPIILTVAYGIFQFFSFLKPGAWKSAAVLLIGSFFIFNLVNNWDVYLLHYPKRGEVVRAWQCGYRQVVNYVKNNYHKFNRFIVTDRLGQPYIFFLFYLKYDPATYQRQAKISAPDEYGFGQIDKFDKFYFKFIFDQKAQKTVFIGYPEDFKGTPINENKIKKIKVRTEEIFWIYEAN